MKLYDDDTHDIHWSPIISLYSPVSILSKPSGMAGLSLVSSSNYNILELVN